ncbi:Cof-type HAD-IIB family hydrolase [Staphylococcus pettenkoferi]|uniref:Cof-type HAD-IIB family hydrolase n=1 Tax=Staphylococcus pettenkoferi TaxID=170573 RepID=A0ABT4BJP8_9STAP|nr:Cof-type HAD-IIB family hydrolase [Staphylococcus pettenkoferi]MCY1564381.1 Cof-type HAD-IIB family hydrolase [Staphylococcus pettenkoferi]MCY1582900.1 Cof-type HAD-IIB family hydrolase [Staphylococcus pettenkoferi]MCY1590626.1 Cof-type HAD-IIB family hydrolase [Staphylococcus pettenkoferi]MCY1593097.1 Cof-type HAD-IIB family hydrolase [Staphylococcus pettenkoferi]MCY1598140.1 Cof-type HAD-IIB family hydrolase [Staphylococcus pettenkoferi]
MDNVQAIFLDMDGTILHSDNRVSEDTTQIIRELREQGYKVFLATGRSHDEIHYLVSEDFSVDGIISSNGTQGKVQDETIFQHGMTLAQVQDIVKLAQNNHIYYEVFPYDGQRRILTEDREWIEAMVAEEEPIGGVSVSEWHSRKDALKDKVEWVEALRDEPYAKIYLFSKEQSQIQTFRDQLIEDQEQLNISVSNSSRFNAETMAYGVNKGTAIKEMIEHFNIPRESTLVIGDSDNDRAMFEFGHYTVAMKNARPEVQALAKDVTSLTNEEDGAARYLEEHLL